MDIVSDEMLESLLVSLELHRAVTDAEYFNLKAAIKDYRNKQSIISQQQRYIGFLQVCARSGERWEGNIDDFLSQGDRT